MLPPPSVNHDPDQPYLRVVALLSPATGIAALPVAEGAPALGQSDFDGAVAEDANVTVVLDDPVPPLPIDVGGAVDEVVAAGEAIAADSAAQGPARHGVRQPRGTGQVVMTNGSHEALAERARDGDVAALQALLELIDSDGSIRIPIRRVVMDSAAVDDISQEVLIKVAERLHRWNGRSRFTTWLYSVARNTAIDHLRRAGPAAEELPIEAISDQQRLSSLVATRRDVQSLLEDLPDAYRQPVWLRDVEQLDYDEIANILQLRPATVRTRVCRGRAMIAAAWTASRA